MIKTLLLGTLLVSLAFAQTVNYIALTNMDVSSIGVTDGVYTYVGTRLGVLVKFKNADMSREGVYYPPDPYNVRNMTLSPAKDYLYVAYSSGSYIGLKKIKTSDLTQTASSIADMPTSSYYSIYADNSYVYIGSNENTASQTIKWYTASNLMYVNTIITEAKFYGIVNGNMYFSSATGMTKVDPATNVATAINVNLAQYGTIQSYVIVGSKIHLITEGSGSFDHNLVTFDTTTNQLTSISIGNLPIENTTQVGQSYKTDATKRSAAIRLQVDLANSNRLYAIVVGYQSGYYGSGYAGDYNQYIIDLTTNQVTKKPFVLTGYYIGTLPSFVKIYDYLLYGDTVYSIQYANTDLPKFCKFDVNGEQTCTKEFINANTKEARRLVYAKGNLFYCAGGDSLGSGGYLSSSQTTMRNTTQICFDAYYDGHYIYAYNAIMLLKINADTLESVSDLYIPNYPYNTFFSMFTYEGEFAYFDRADGAVKRYDQTVIKSIPNYVRGDFTIYPSIDPSGRYVFFLDGTNIKRYDFQTNTYATAAAQGAINRFVFHNGFAYSTGANNNQLIKFNMETLEHVYTKTMFTHVGNDVDFYYRERHNLVFVGDKAYMGADGVGVLKINLADGVIEDTITVGMSGVNQLAQGDTTYFTGGKALNDWIGFFAIDGSSTSAPSSGPSSTSAPGTTSTNAPGTSSTVAPSSGPSSTNAPGTPSTSSTGAPGTPSSEATKPAGENISGNNNARASSATTVTVSGLVLAAVAVALL
jgi:hypothetical protein